MSFSGGVPYDPLLALPRVHPCNVFGHLAIWLGWGGPCTPTIWGAGRVHRGNVFGHLADGGPSWAPRGGDARIQVRSTFELVFRSIDRSDAGCSTKP